ncbi:type I polyketide synthase [Streptomyces sp. NPDC056309]|uniref:type I polyketide synthase n=1 Tax=Streptomyces sp. NPDC056309 TaxID=3345781 RepID=UPI0035D97531
MKSSKPHSGFSAFVRDPMTRTDPMPEPQQNQQEKVVDYLRRVTNDLRRARRRIGELESRDNEPVAIVGMSCRLPGGVSSPESLWELVESGGDAISGFPADRGWDIEALTGNGEGSSSTHEGGFLYEATDFDAGFFGISPREATAMDPQQRLLLEVSWEALERAGIAPTSLRSSATGVFVGSYHWGAPSADTAAELHGHALTGTAASVLSGRLSYVYGLEGPAVTVDTACSSSLVALHMAARSLRSGESSLALVGGVTILAEPSVFVEFSAQGGLAPDGRCKAFSDAADGTGWGEGVGVLVVERLSDAVRNGHPVLAVLRGSAVNQDGASNGLTAPNGRAQEQVIRQALSNCGLTGADVDAVEAHGTGTRLGDPIEAQALLATYGQEHGPEQPLWLGSLKSNIGHTQAAAGVAGVIKMVMALRHGVLPRTLHAALPSTHVDWESGHVRLLSEATDWPETGRPRRAAVSSFGISGTNAHAVLEQAPVPAEDAGAEDAPQQPAVVPGALPWLLCAHSEQALRDQAAALVTRLDADTEPRPQDVGHSLLSSRALLERRAVVGAAGRDDLLTGSRALAEGQSWSGLVDGTADVEGRTVFVFPGQGSQWVGMGAQLLDESTVFAEWIAECADALGEFTDWNLIDVLRGVEGAPTLERVDVVQPASFAVMVSLAAVWRAQGVEPDAVVGHSQGEIAAAVVSGALSLRDGARVVALRSQAIGRSLAGRGGMMSVALPVADVEARLEAFGGRVSVAAENGPRSCVVSGEPGALDELSDLLTAEDVRVRRVPVDYASHSHHVEDLHDEILELLAEVEPTASEIPLFSTVTGDWLDTTAMDAGYWYRSLRGRVLFADAVSGLLAAEHRAFIEVSSHPVLAMSVQDMIDDAGVPGVASGTLRRDNGGLDRFLLSAAEVFVRGVHVDWAPLFEGTGALRVDLPTYAFQHERYWISRAVVDRSATAPMDAEFWAAVEQADVSALTEALGTDEESVAAILSGLASWRRTRGERSTLDSWRYRVTWEPLARVPRAALDGTWLLVSADGVDGTDVAEALETGGAEVRRLVLDETCTDPAVLRERLTDTDGLTGIVSVLADAEQDSARHTGLTLGLALSVSLAQALGEADVPAPLWFLTRGAFSTGPSDTVTRPLQSQVAGLGWTVAVEHPRRWGGVVDLPGTLDARAAQRLVAALAGALGDDDQLAVRPAGVLARRVIRASGDTRRRTRSWKPRGTTLVTGGSGTLAPGLARHLSAHGAEHLVLLSRRGADAPGAAELAAELEEAGTETQFAACDITDRDAVAALLDGLKAEGRTVRTVVHTAAVIELSALADTTVDAFAEVVHAKVTGARILDELLDDEELDDFVLYSSTAGMWGSGVHAAYVAGNAYLAALAEQRRARGARATSIHWGKWPDDLERELADPHQIRRSGLEYLDPELALTALQRVMEDDETVIGLMDIDWGTYHDVFTAGRPSHLFDRIPEVARLLADRAAPAATATAGSGLTGRLQGVSAAEQDRIVLALVREETAAVLGHASADTVPERRAFRDIGFDSVTAVDLRNRLVAATGLTLPSTMVFDHPNAVALAAFLKATALGTTGTAGDRPAAAVTAGADDDPIVIVGMSCRFPGGAGTPEELLRLALDGADAISEFPAERGWDAHGLYDPDPDRQGRTYSVHGGFLHEAAGFDPGFFGISPREALAMDPQQRLLLETSWEALERAGIDPESLRSTATGTFFGASYQDYSSSVQNGTEGTEVHMMTGTAASVLSGRVSYLLGLEGPAVTVDTACSSSLVAMHLACQSLRSGESSLALAGGAAIMATPHAFVGFSRQRALAENGRCKPFAEAADGMTLAEGVGVVLLEKLSDARRHGHRVLAVVRGSAINQDGASNGLTAPNGVSQQRVIRQALANAGLGTADIDVVEAHGTGTKLGDPIEAGALLATYGQGRDGGQPLLLGSVKSNIGHTQAAAGVAGVIKMVMAMQAGELPGTLHVDEPSSHVDWTSGAVTLLRERTAWPGAEDRPRRAGVSSFGISGTNAHLLLEQAPPAEEPAEDPEDAPLVPWPLSAKSARALREQASRLLTATAGATAAPARVGHALATTRSAFDHRAVVLGSRPEDFTRGLEAVVSSASVGGVVTGTAGPDSAGPVFVYPGQGSQWWGMGRELLATSEVFRTAVDDCAAALAPYTDWSLHEVLAGEGDPELLERVDVVQPALFSMMVALTALWRAHGVEPAAVVGHSQGEIAAAHVAGALSLEDAALVVALRSQALPQLSGLGGMMSVSAPAERVTELLEPWGEALSIAAVNGPSSVIVSGDADALDELLETCREQNVRARRVSVDYASHGRHVEAVREELARVLAPVSPRTPEVPFYSTVTGARLDEAAFDGFYWYTNLRQTVLMEDATRALVAAGHRVFVEISPHPVLAAPIQETQESLAEAAEAAETGAVLGTLRRNEGDRRRFLTSLAEAHTHGIAVDWTTVFDRPAYAPVDLPTYPFQRQDFWPEPRAAAAAGTADASDAAFWELVENQDLAALAGELGIPADDDASHLGDVLPALSAWRTRSLTRSRVDALRYHVEWNRAAEPGPARPTGRLLAVISPDHAGAPWVAAVLDALGPDTVRFEAKDTDRAAWAAQLAQLREDEGEFHAVVSLLAVAEALHTDFASVPLGLAQTLALVQALGDAELSAPLWCLTRGGVSAGRGDVLSSPVQGALWGLGRVIGLEHPDRWGGLIDLPETLDTRAAARLTGLLADAGGEDQLAIRGSGVLARRLAHAAPAVPGSGKRPPVRGSVLVTGGTGGIGGRVARRLAEQGAAHLVLTSRRGADAPGAAELRAELEQLGVRVTIAACDAADRDALAALLAGLPEDAPLTAVFHSAGVAHGDAPVADLTLDQLDALMRAKLTAARHLHELTAHLDLDAFVLFSSGAAVWGSGGQPGYAAANAYLDALAEHRRSLGLTGSSVAWGTWGEVGMATDPEVHDRLVRQGVLAMEPAHALGALDRMLEDDDTALAVTLMDWELFAPAFTANRPSALLSTVPEAVSALADEGPAAADGSGAAVRPLRARLDGLPTAERGRALVEAVRAEASATLGHDSPDAVPASRAFRDVGFDSVTAVELRNRLRSALGLPLPAALVFDYPTPAALAQHIGSLLYGTAPDDADTGRADDPDARIREALATVPIGRLRKAGLLDMVLKLAESDDVEDSAPATDDTADSLDDMDAEALLRLAAQNSAN